MDKLISYLNSFELEFFTTTRLCQLLGIPEWSLAEFLRPILLSGKLSFIGENCFGIDMWQLSEGENINSSNTFSFSLARLERARSALENQPWEIRNGLTGKFESLLREHGLFSELYRQILDCLHLVAKGKSRNEISKLGYTLKPSDLGNWYNALKRLEQTTTITSVNPGIFKKHKIIDRLYFEQPQVIGISYLTNFQPILLALGLFTCDLDNTLCVDPQTLRDLSSCRFVFVPLSEDEENQVSELDIQSEALLRASYMGEEVIFRSSICKVLGVESKPVYLNWSAHSSAKIDFATPDIVERLLNEEWVDGVPSILNNNQKEKVLALL